MPRPVACCALATVISIALAADETASTLGQDADTPCRVEIIDASNDWPVPMIELRTTSNVRFVTDNAGLIAVDTPELMDRETWFFVSGHGYEVPADGFGYRGVRITPKCGKTFQIKVIRTSIAKRLGRITGAGLFAESQKLGEGPDMRESGVVGCDSVQIAVHRGRLFWLWGDTTLFHYPLGVFHASSATTPIRPIESFEPPINLTFDCFLDNNSIPRSVAKMPGQGPTWLTCYISLPDNDGNDRLVAIYSKVRKPMNVYEWGQCVWNDQEEQFERTEVVWREESDANGETSEPQLPAGHATFWTDDDGVKWVLFGNPLPKFRCLATFESWLDVESWERLTPQENLPVAGHPTAEVKPHSGSIAWHPWRKRWVTVFMQAWGDPSAFGEVWYAEADAPIGPWGPAVKILSHDNYTFYNPRLHAEWFATDSPVLIFEGTFSQMFADRPEPTPRYDYNQILYRLDLDDIALRLSQSSKQ